MPTPLPDRYSYALRNAPADIDALEVDVTHWAGKHLKAALFSDPIRGWVDLANPYKDSLPRGGAIFDGRFGTQRFGVRGVTQFNGTSAVVDWQQSYSASALPSWRDPNGQHSAIVLMDVVSSGDEGTIFSERDGSPTNVQFYIQASYLRLRQGDTAPEADAKITARGPVLTGYSRNVDNSVRFYENGRGQGADIPTGDPDGVDIPLSVGARWQGYPTTAFHFDERIFFVLLFDDLALTDAQHAELYRDIWQLFRPKRAPLAIFPDVGPGPIPGSGSFAGSSTVDADGRIQKFGSGAFAGSAVFAADARVVKLGAGSFAGSATTQADGRIGGAPQPGSGTFAGASAFAADGVLVKRAAGTFAGASAVSADGRRIKRGAGSFVGAATAQADGRVTSGTSGSFAGTSAIQADGRVVRVYRDNANFAANSAFQGDGRIGGAQDGSGTFAGASAMSAAGRQLYRSTGIFAGSSIWFGNGIIPSQTIGPIDKPGLVSGSPQPGLTSKSPKRGVIGSQGGL